MKLFITDTTHKLIENIGIYRLFYIIYYFE